MVFEKKRQHNIGHESAMNDTHDFIVSALKVATKNKKSVSVGLFRWGFRFSTLSCLPDLS